jgi:anti-sigma factor RsiW
MRAHLEGCPACHEDHASLRELVAETESGSA